MNEAQYQQWIENLAGEKAVLEAENEYLKGLISKNNKKGKRKAPKVEKMGRLIMFPARKKVKSSD